jgi:hypothetical protein
MIVALPAVPLGTEAVVCAGSAAPGETVLVYGLPPIAVPPNVIATLSSPAAVGVYVAV